MNRLSNAVYKRNTGMWRAIFLAAMLMTVVLSPARAEDGAQPAGDDMQQKTMPDMGDMNMQGMDMSPAEGEASLPDASQPPAVRDPHAYGDGDDFGPIPRPRFADEQRFASLLMDRLEWVHTSRHTTAAYDLQTWYGRDYDRAVLKAEGDVDGGSLQEARTELLWGHAVASFWDTQIGARYDSGVDPGRGWLACGVQGLAPYWFEVDAAAYLSDAGHSALRLSADYELLLTQKLILKPRLEANFYGKDDVARALGQGLSDLAAGIRLRYEIRREFAPYVGIEWMGKYGGTADFARAAGDAAEETRWVAGVRFWF
jgi:copper resistance protein B